MNKEKMQQFNQTRWVYSSNGYLTLENLLKEIQELIKEDNLKLMGVTINPPHWDKHGFGHYGKMTIVLSNQIIGIEYDMHSHLIVAHKYIEY